MQCQVCNKELATIHLTEINDGVRTEMHLCEHCAQQQGIVVQSQISVNELLSSLLGAQPSGDDQSAVSGEQSPCPYCGFTLERFQKETVLGCPHDYELFEKQLLPLIEKTQDGKSIHCGKVPSRTTPDTRKTIECSNLRAQLATAVKSENYELAARLRDKLEQIE